MMDERESGVVSFPMLHGLVLIGKRNKALLILCNICLSKIGGQWLHYLQNEQTQTVSTMNKTLMYYQRPQSTALDNPNKGHYTAYFFCTVSLRKLMCL